MPYASTAISNRFLEMRGGLGAITQMQMQKLVYIAHGWNLALNYEPLIEEHVRAWDYGPVFPELYDHARYYGKQPITRLITPADRSAATFFLTPHDYRGEPYTALLDPDERAVIEQVWRKYSNFSAFELSDMTHRSGTPWHETYFKYGKNSVIDNSLIAEHYRKLADLAQQDDGAN